jgi:maltose phosphorylase
MAGTWLAIVEGFGGMQITDHKVRFNPLIPEQWKSYSFNARFRGSKLVVKVTHEDVIIKNFSEKALKIIIFGKEHQIPGAGSSTFNQDGK